MKLVSANVDQKQMFAVINKDEKNKNADENVKN